VNKVMTAAEIVAAMQAAGVSMETLAAEHEKTKAAPAETKKAKSKLITNQAQAEAAKPGVHRVKDAVGLYLKKGENGAGARFRRFWFDGKRRAVGLGPLADVKLSEARDRADAVKQQLKAGVDPITAKRTAKADAAAKAKAETLGADRWDFARAAEDYLAAHASSWKHPRARALWLNPLAKYAYPVLGKMPLDDIRVQHVDAVMTAAVDGGAPLMPPRIRLRIEQVLNAANRQGQARRRTSQPGQRQARQRRPSGGAPGRAGAFPPHRARRRAGRLPEA
jgi:hypothetical protein